MLAIKLSRIGKKKQPVYRVIVTEKSRDPWGRSVEIIGQYNPRTNPKTIVFKEDRAKYWLSVGAQPTKTVRNLLINAGIMKGDKAKAVAITNKRRSKLNEAKAEAEEKEKAAKEAAAEAEAAKKAEAEAAKEAEKEAEAKAKAEKEAEAAEKVEESKDSDATEKTEASDDAEAAPEKVEADKKAE